MKTEEWARRVLVALDRISGSLMERSVREAEGGSPDVAVLLNLLKQVSEVSERAEHLRATLALLDRVRTAQDAAQAQDAAAMAEARRLIDEATESGYAPDRG